jgi:hypothetical protein
MIRRHSHPWALPHYSFFYSPESIANQDMSFGQSIPPEKPQIQLRVDTDRAPLRADLTY